MKKIIAITGTHGTGKTTLAFKMAAHYKQLGHNVKVVQEVARSCPFPINDKMTLDTCLWIYHEHSKKELEAQKDHDIVICDRTYFDSFIYAEVLKISPDWISEKKEYLLEDIPYDYGQIILVRPDSKIKDDGIRDLDKKFQKKIDECFYRNRSYGTIEIKSSDIFSPKETWKQYCI